MSSQFGVVVRRTASAARPMQFASSTTLGIVGMVEGGETDLHFFGDLKKAKAYFRDSQGTIKGILGDLERQNLTSPLVISVTGSSEEKAVGAAVEKLQEAYGKFSFKPDVVLAPGFSHLPTVGKKIEESAQSLRAVGFLDAQADSEIQAIKFAEQFSSERLVICDPGVKISMEETRPLSTFMAGLMAKTDGAWEYGFADSFSNRSLEGVLGLDRVVEFIPGEDCEADRLRSQGITTVIPYQGLRAWGGETRSQDPIWKSLTRVRIFDKVMQAASSSLFWAIDRRADVLKTAQDSVEQMMNNLKGANVLLGFNIFWDPERNTRTNITDGKFYLTAEMQEYPIVKRFEITFSYVDRFGDVLMKEIS